MEVLTRKRNRQPMKESTKEKIRQAMLRIGHLPPSQLGKTRSTESKERISVAKKGSNHSEETRQKMSENRMGEKNHFYGKSHTRSSRKKMSDARDGITGDKCWNWIKDRNQVIEKHRLRGTSEWKEWRIGVFERDEYTCQECGEGGSNLEPHHIVPLRISMDTLFDLTNGITLCRPCHQKTIWKESEFEERYFRIVSMKKM